MGSVLFAVPAEPTGLVITGWCAAGVIVAGVMRRPTSRARHRGRHPQAHHTAAVVSPTVNRWTNIVLPSLYVVSIVASAIGETSAYYWFLSIAESALLLLIVWYAWTWPRRVGTP
jgi:hypothetical protein